MGRGEGGRKKRESSDIYGWWQKVLRKKTIKQCKEMKRMTLVFKIQWSRKIYLIE